ncbi:hypothetical protein T492DRAFT_836800 [Pavlovales sp. CCMP2436]|nr:hypothetical protein T492DRAFT_836800 [Pavlovales sp. CCMP2436]
MEPGSGGGQHGAAGGTTQAEYKRYLQLLSERNVLRKRIQERATNGMHELKQREAGFDVYVSGANRPRVQRKEVDVLRQPRPVPRLRTGSGSGLNFAPAGSGGVGVGGGGASGGVAGAIRRSSVGGVGDSSESAPAHIAPRVASACAAAAAAVLSDAGERVRLRPHHSLAASEGDEGEEGGEGGGDSATLGTGAVGGGDVGSSGLPGRTSLRGSAELSSASNLSLSTKEMQLLRSSLFVILHADTDDGGDSDDGGGTSSDYSEEGEGGGEEGGGERRAPAPAGAAGAVSGAAASSGTGAVPRLQMGALRAMPGFPPGLPPSPGPYQGSPGLGGIPPGLPPSPGLPPGLPRSPALAVVHRPPPPPSSQIRQPQHRGAASPFPGGMADLTVTASAVTESAGAFLEEDEMVDETADGADTAAAEEVDSGASDTEPAETGIRPMASGLPGAFTGLPQRQGSAGPARVQAESGSLTARRRPDSGTPSRVSDGNFLASSELGAAAATAVAAAVAAENAALRAKSLQNSNGTAAAAADPTALSGAQPPLSASGIASPAARPPSGHQAVSTLGQAAGGQGVQQLASANKPSRPLSGLSASAHTPRAVARSTPPLSAAQPAAQPATHSASYTATQPATHSATQPMPAQKPTAQLAYVTPGVSPAPVTHGYANGGCANVRKESGESWKVWEESGESGGLLDRVFGMGTRRQRELLKVLDKLDAMQAAGHNLESLWGTIAGSDSSAEPSALASPRAEPASRPFSTSSAQPTERGQSVQARGQPGAGVGAGPLTGLHPGAQARAEVGLDAGAQARAEWRSAPNTHGTAQHTQRTRHSRHSAA